MHYSECMQTGSIKCAVVLCKHYERTVGTVHARVLRYRLANSMWRMYKVLEYIKTCSTCTCTRNIQYAHTVTARNTYSMRNLNQITSIMYPAQHTLQILVTGTVRTTGHQWLTLSSQHYSRSTVHEHHGSRCTNQQYNVPTYEWQK